MNQYVLLLKITYGDGSKAYCIMVYQAKNVQPPTAVKINRKIYNQLKNLLPYDEVNLQKTEHPKYTLHDETDLPF